MPLQGTRFLEYAFDEADSGLAPTEIVDRIAGYNLTITAPNGVTDLEYFSDAAGRGIDSKNTNSSQRALRAIDNTSDQFRDNLDGATTFTMEFRAAFDAIVSQNNRIFVAQDNSASGPNPSFGLSGVSLTSLRFYISGTIFTWNPGANPGDLSTYHVVFDSNRTDDTGKRFRIFRDNVEIYSIATTLGETVSLDNNVDWTLFNRASGGTFSRSPDVRVKWLALYTAPLTDAQRANNVTELNADDDQSPAAPTVSGSGAFARDISAALSAAGDINPPETVVGTGGFARGISAALDASGTITPPPEVDGTGAFARGISAALSAAGDINPPETVAGAGGFARGISAALDASGTITPPPEVDGTGAFARGISAALSASGAISEPGTVSGTGGFARGISATLAAEGSISVEVYDTGSSIYFERGISAALSASGNINAPDTVVGAGGFARGISAALDASGTITPPPEVDGAGGFARGISAALSASGAISAAGSVVGAGGFARGISATLDASGTITPPPEVDGAGGFARGISAALSAAGSIAPPGAVAGAGAFARSISAVLSATGLIRIGSAFTPGARQFRAEQKRRRVRFGKSPYTRAQDMTANANRKIATLEAGEVSPIQFDHSLNLVPEFEPADNVTVDHIIRPVRDTGVYFIATTRGVTGTREPVWPITVGATIQSGTVTFEAIAFDDARVPTIVSSTWSASTVAAALSGELREDWRTEVTVTASADLSGETITNTVTLSDGRVESETAEFA